MAMMSSAMASVCKNTVMPLGMPRPTSDSTASENAMSVAMGMPKPCACSVPKLKQV